MSMPFLTMNRERNITMSAPRLPYPTLAPKAFEAMLDLNGALAGSTLGKPLINLVNQRVSLMNGCAYCVDLHWHDLLQDGEHPQRINSLPTWRETSLYTEREQAALAWAESVTDLHRTHAGDADFAALKPHFTDTEIADLTFAITTMNAWNRLAIAFRNPVARRK
jgi:AhpD family alkylhydroperoxidase